MSALTKHLLSFSERIKTEPEITPGGEHFKMFNTGGVEVEVAELLYSLVRCWKPRVVVETGTHLGISSAYIAEALRDNGSGYLTTYEVIPSLKQQAEALWEDLGLTNHVQCLLQPSLTAQVTSPIDFLFLDSEPQYRFDEFLKFWPLVKEGGLIAIHDLHPSLGHHGQTHHNTYDWPYGYWRDKLSSFVEKFDVQLIHVPNPRGMVLFQKTKETDENIVLLREVSSQ